MCSAKKALETWSYEELRRVIRFVCAKRVSPTEIYRQSIDVCDAGVV